MSNVELSDALLAKLAGWEAVKQARALLEGGRVLSSFWEAPLLRGVVQEGSASYRAGLVIKSASDAENMCPCRQSRQYGMICAHSIAVGLHHLKRQSTPEPTTGKSQGPAKDSSAKPSPAEPIRSAKALRRVGAGESGEPLELFIILPPNFAQAAGKGRIMLCLEGKWRSGRTPLTALPLTTTFAPNAQDAAILDALETLNGGETPAMAMLTASQFADLLPKLINHPGLTIGRSQSLEVTAQTLPLDLRASLESNGEIVLKLTGSVPTGVLQGKTSWVINGASIQPLGLPAGLESLFNGPLRIPRSQVPQFLNLQWPKLEASGAVQANFSLQDFVLEPATPRFQLKLAGGLATLQANLDCFYGEKKVTPGSASGSDALWLADPQSPTRYSTRNFAAEQAALSRLLKYGFSLPDAQGVSKLNVQNLILKFFAREYPQLEREWSVTLEERLERSTRQNLERIEPRFQITPSGEQWFDLGIVYDTPGGESFSPADIQRLLLSGQSHTRLKNGKFAIIDTGAVEELQEVLLDCAPQQNAAGYRLNNIQTGYLEATLRQHSNWKVQAPTAWSQRARSQSGEVKLEAPALGELESVLRPYQKDGVAWLQFLRANHFGGILADEMGLGKTLQALAHLYVRHSANRETDTDSRRLMECGSLLPLSGGHSSPKPLASSYVSESGGKPRALHKDSFENPPAPEAHPTLVVAPTSLVFNWAAEAAKFTPNLRVLTIQGSQRRELFDKISKHDLVLTSYALLRRDIDQYRGLEFDTLILDEAQHIKNRQTQNAQAVKSIRAHNRLVLTGTPLENSVLDLWSIFDFLMPGYLGTAQDFRERYEVAITRDKNAEAQTRLARRLRPFMLRRLKREVAKDLPEKIEQVSYCELSDTQRAVYQQMLEASRNEILSAVGEKGLGKSRMVILTALLRLRQICCDLRLLQPAKDANNTSGKLEMFGELLEEVLDGGHRVLVFSQFTSMLALLREHLAAENIDYCYLDGSTQNRAEVVEKFQRNDRISVFLISLKAGGVGLNLTGADTVIHFDPWWNPAVEAQATDRAHRIGQKRVVTSYKLITRDTVEEKILKLQTKKRALIEGMLGDEEQLANSLSWEEIQELLTS